MPSSDREDKGFHPTIFILWGVEPVYMTLLVRRSPSHMDHLASDEVYGSAIGPCGTRMLLKTAL
jgi:hypothetical protein